MTIFHFNHRIVHSSHDRPLHSCGQTELVLRVYDDWILSVILSIDVLDLPNIQYEIACDNPILLITTLAYNPHLVDTMNAAVVALIAVDQTSSPW